MLPLLTAWLLLAGGCGTAGKWTAVPAPFRPVIKPLPEMPLIAERDIVVIPPQLPAAAEKSFFFELSRQTDPAELLILKQQPTRPTHLLEGLEKPGDRIDWYLTHASGGTIAQFSTPLPDTADGGSMIGRKIAANLVSALRPDLKTEAETSLDAPTDELIPDRPPGSANDKPPKLSLGEIDGAPGDGNRALSLALARLFASGPFQMVEPADEADFVITANIEIASSGPGREIINLNWRLADANNREVALIQQVNEIPAGFLDGPWDDVAFDIAEGAAAGLAEAIAAADRPPNEPPM